MDAESYVTGPEKLTRLENQVSVTRHQLSLKLEELRQRLEPEALMNRGIDNMAQYFSDGRNSITRFIRENPIPSALAAGAFAWMIARVVSRSGSSSLAVPKATTTRLKEQSKHIFSEVGRRVSDYAHSASRQASSTAKVVGERAEEAGRDISKTAERLGSQVSEGMRSTQDRMMRLYDENPVALTLATVAAGALLAFLPIRTRPLSTSANREEEQPQQYH